jgi:hypothetical protein
MHACGSASFAARTRHFEDLSNLRAVNCIIIIIIIIVIIRDLHFSVPDTKKDFNLNQAGKFKV